MAGLCNHSLELTGLAGDPASPVHRLDPRAKLIGSVALTVIAVTTPLAAWPAFVACAVALAAVAAAARVPAAVIWRRARLVLPLILFVAVFLPFMREGGTDVALGPVTVSSAGLAVFAAVAIKAALGTVSAVLLGATTPYPDVLRAMEALRVPRTFTLISSFMYRYLFVIVEEVQRTRAALAARAFRPRLATHAAPLGRAATALFLRSYGRGERVYLAMLARGYTGTMPVLRPLRLRTVDVAAPVALVAVLVAVRVAAEVAA